MSEIKITKLSRPGCRPCAILDGLLTEAGIGVERVDIAETPGAVERYALTSVPVLVFERDGTEVGRLNGLVGIDEIEAKLNELGAVE